MTLDNLYHVMRAMDDGALVVTRNGDQYSVLHPTGQPESEPEPVKKVAARRKPKAASSNVGGKPTQ